MTMATAEFGEEMAAKKAKSFMGFLAVCPILVQITASFSCIECLHHKA